MSGEHTDVSAYLAQNPTPMQVWVGPAAAPRVGEHLAETLGGGGPDRRPEGHAPAEVAFLYQDPDGPTRHRGPAVMVLHADDLWGERRESLLRLAWIALPGRPVVLGGERHKDTLLDAINTWQAFRMLPDGTPPAALVDSVRKAHQSLALRHAITSCVEELRKECARLAEAGEGLRHSRDKLLHAERLNTVGRITEPLLDRVAQQQRLMGRVEGCLDDAGLPGDVRRCLENALEMARAIKVSLEDMQSLVGRGDGVTFHPEVGELDLLVERAGNIFRLDSLLRRRKFSVACASGARVRMDRHRMVHVLMNLVRNAAQATEVGDAVVLRTRRDARGWALVEVEDSGHGIPEADRDKVLRAFFTTKGTAGTGLGLMMCRRAVELHGGELSYESTPGRGTCFRIALPVAP